MENTQFQVGDIVQLKSGSPHMTVVDHQPGLLVQVIYYRGGDQDFSKQALESAILKKV